MFDSFFRRIQIRVCSRRRRRPLGGRGGRRLGFSGFGGVAGQTGRGRSKDAGRDLQCRDAAAVLGRCAGGGGGAVGIRTQVCDTNKIFPGGGSNSLTATMASTSLSWASSSLLQNHSSFSNNVSTYTMKGTDRVSVLTVVAQKKVKKLRKIILKKDVTELGKKGQLMDVKAGYLRNYLLPMGMAQIVTPGLFMEMKMEEERIEAEKKRVKEEAEHLALIFETVGAFKVKRKGGKGKQIFGSVTAQDLVDIIKAQLQRDVDKRIISLPEIRETGEYIAELKLHPEVIARLRLNVYAN